MRANQGLSIGYECQDTLQFLDETLACYTQMLKSDIACRKNRSSHRRDNNTENQAQPEQSNRTRKAFVFKSWLERTLEVSHLENKKSTVCTKPKDNKEYNGNTFEIDDKMNESAEVVFENSDISRRFGYCEPEGSKEILQTSIIFDDFDNFGQGMQSGIESTRANIVNSPDISLSLMTNYEPTTPSSCYSFFGEDFDQADYCGEDDNVFKNFYEGAMHKPSYFVPLSDNDGLKSRPGSWSDSGYCCDKSDSDYSRFSSLSFSDGQAARNYSTRGSNSSKECESSSDQGIQINVKELSETLNLIVLDDIRSENYSSFGNEQYNETTRKIFNSEQYSPEELEILKELMENPENCHETTKELSDIGRDVSSKGWKRRHSKAKITIRQFFRRIVGNVRKSGSEKRKSRSETKDVEMKESRKLKVRNRRHSLSPFSRHRRSSSLKSPKKSFSLHMNINKKKIQRASSYSSLFGRRGSVFSHFERAENSQVMRRAQSYDILQTKKEEVYHSGLQIEDIKIDQESRSLFDMQDITCDCYNEPSLMNSCKLCSLSCDCCEFVYPYEFIEDFGRSPMEDDIGFVAPLKMNVSEKRSAFTRRLVKLRDIA